MEPFVPNLDDPGTLERHGRALRQALTIRLAEQRLLELFAAGKLFGTLHTCIGQEFVGPAVAAGLREPDTVFSNHRCHGHFMAVTDQVEGLIAEIMGKATGVCGGLGGSQHLHFGRFYSNGVLGGIAPVATGLALAQRSDAAGGISVVFVGDGALGEGVLYESLNIASRWELPLLIVLENNQVAQSAPQHQTLAGGIDERFQAFGIETTASDTWRWDRLMSDMSASVTRVRETGRPRLHRVDTYRLMGHSKGDDTRPDDEVEPFRRRDPLNLILSRHADHPWLARTLGEIRARLDRAVSSAEAAPFGSAPAPATVAPPPRWQPARFARDRVANSIRAALEEALERDPKARILGEDVESPYGGAFKVTAGMSDRFGERVRNTPVSEAAIVGVGSGLALAGQHPVVEIMFGDFLTLATDQWINHAAKFASMYGRSVRVPLTVRTPMGGKRGYGPTHSQSLERLLVAQPGTRVLALHHRASPADLYREVFAASDRPTLVLENKLLYGAFAEPEPPRGFELLRSEGPFAVTRLRPQGEPDVTLVAIGGMSVEAERAQQVLFEEHEVLVDLFLPSQLYPLSVEFLRESLASTNRLIVAEEGQGFASLGSEILAQAAELSLRSRIVSARVHAEACPIPASRPLEAAVLPGADAIVTRVLEVMRG